MFGMDKSAAVNDGAEATSTDSSGIEPRRGRAKLLSFRWLNLHHLVVAVVFIAIFTMAVRYPADEDTWWHLRAGQVMVESHTILTTDLFSHTRTGQSWVDHGWLGQLFWYGLLALGGWSLVSLGLACIVTISFWLIWQQSEGNLYLKAFALILGAIASSLVWAARPQMISFMLAALVALLLDRFKRRQTRLLPWLPLIVVLWVNLHGGFAIAFILMICYAVGEVFNHLTTTNSRGRQAGWGQIRHLLLTIGICLAVVVINPHTWRMWLYPFQTVGIGVLRDFIAEWQSPNFHQSIIQPFLVMLLLLLTAIARSGKRVDWTDLALVGAWTTLSFFAVRYVAIFALIATPILVRYGQLALEAQFGPLALGQKRRLPNAFYFLNWILLSMVLVGALAQMIVTLSPASIQRAESERFPTEAVRFIRETQPAGPMFNSYNFGGYLIYHLWPDYQVFVDGRTDLYDDQFLRTYLQTALALPGWQAQIDQAGIRLILVEPNSPLAIVLQNTSDWKQIFEDKQAVIFQKQASAK
jgi:hypothetical protein